MKITEKEILEEAQKLLAKPNGWTQRAMARDCVGNVVYDDLMRSIGVSFCSMGAISMAGQRLGATVQQQENAIVLLEKALGHDGVISFNDSEGRTRDQVLTLFDQAIKLDTGEAK